MGLTKNYATTMYNWLSKFAPTFRSPILSSVFDEKNPQPNEYIEYSADMGNFNSDFIIKENKCCDFLVMSDSQGMTKQDYDTKQDCECVIHADGHTLLYLLSGK